jgi:carotenoid 1,2-hydratase
MTERGRPALARSAPELRVGPSRVAWDGALTIEVDEIAVPIPLPLRGTVRFEPALKGGRAYSLDEAGRHRWRPYAPAGRVEVAFDRPRMAWRGHAYLDGNDGDEPLEAAFRDWTWMRAGAGAGASVFYDVNRRSGGPFSLALAFDETGERAIEAPPMRPLPGALWRVERTARSEGAPRLLRTLEDAPFYARSLVETGLGGESVMAVHEALSLDRFAAPWVKMLLPFRMPRRAGAVPARR